MHNKRKFIYGCLVALVLLVLIFAVIIFVNQDSELKVVFLNIGQGDSILISQGSQQLLIDGGKDGKLLLEKLGKFVPFWDRRIETIVVTHPDQDHIGGLVGVLQAYAVGAVLETKMQSESQTFKRLEEEIVAKGSQKIEAKKGVKIEFGNGATAEILYPFESVVDINGKDTNQNSVVVKLTVGENKFLFTGDLPSEQENELLAKQIDVQSQILKVAHHGSKYATSNEFLEKVDPVDAIISVGKNNSYGHPNQEVLQRLLSRRVNILRTDEGYDIEYDCEGKCKMLTL